MRIALKELFVCALTISLIGCNNKCEHLSVIVDAAVSPTCTIHGLTEGLHCQTCGETLVAQEIVEPLGHDYVIDEAIEPTCLEDGLTVGIHCSRCDSIIVAQKCLNKKQHVKGSLKDIIVSNTSSIQNPGLFECLVCHQEFLETITYQDIDMPIMSIYGDLSGISKDNKKKITASYFDDKQAFSLCATLKLQGASSLNYPKKNYNIQFFKDSSYSSKQKVTLIESWGKRSKYTLKANWTDFSGMRNVVSGKLYGDVVRSRNKNDEYNTLINGGAIDGYPIALFENDIYQGLYTLNTSKDKYLFNMDGDETSREAILMVKDWSDSGRLKEHIPENFGDSWELEYASTEDDESVGTSWVVDSFNNMMDFVNNNDGQSFIMGIDNYINIQRAIDSMLFTLAIKALDNSSKNILWVTYNGVQWTPSVYDMDGTWGCYWNGNMDKVGSSKWEPTNCNILWDKINKNMGDVVAERWKQLRSGPLSIKNIDYAFVNFYNLIYGKMYEWERRKWPETPGLNTNHLTQIINWANEYMLNMDDKFGFNSDNKNAFKIDFKLDEHVSVKVFVSSDYCKDPNLASSSFSRDGSGFLSTSNAQCSFCVEVEEGYELDRIDIDGFCAEIKREENCYYTDLFLVNTISSDLKISVFSRLIG